jgi:hypothetical protein
MGPSEKLGAHRLCHLTFSSLSIVFFLASLKSKSGYRRKYLVLS